MKNILSLQTAFALALVVILSTAAQGLAADCLAIRQQIEKETDILQRKELAQQGISDCPNDPIINFEYAYSMERFRKYKLALKHYQVAAKLAPKFAKSYFGMGDMYMQLERAKDAVKAYETGLSLEPENKRASNSLKEAKIAAKKQGGGDDEIAGFVNPLAEEKPATKTEPRASKKAGPATPPMPYEPKQALILQEPEVMKPLTTTPLADETLQAIDFNKAGHSDITGSLDDSQMGAD